jgi:tetratricopeptide (TPR) repeat protein
LFSSSIFPSSRRVFPGRLCEGLQNRARDDPNRRSQQTFTRLVILVYCGMSDRLPIDLLMHQATAAREAGALTEADALCRRILELEPIHEPALKLRFAIAHQQKRFQDALSLLDEATRADPTNVSWWIGRAWTLASLGLQADAVIAYDQAIALSPLDHEYHRGRALALIATNRLADALASCDTAIALRPDAAGGHLVKGHALRRLHRYDEALAAFDSAIELEPESGDAWYSKALLLLLMGRYREGWALHEWRWFAANFPQAEHLFPQPIWDGTPLNGQTLLVWVEQGLGDSIQFYRFVNEVRRQGPVALLVSPRLARLFAAQPGAPLIATAAADLPRFDLHCPMLSLPYLLETELETIPAAPYLRADPDVTEAWRTRLTRVAGQPRIGIVWAGNNKNADDFNRSMTLATMLSMFDGAGLDTDATIVSLQMNVPDSDRDTLRSASNILDLSEEQESFADTAAVIGHLDLVISVDTAVAHLAGALGTPVWILLSAAADWRWLIGRNDSPWYPSAQLFRQGQPGDWSGVACQVRAALKAMKPSEFRE